MPEPGDRNSYDPNQPRVPKGYSGGGRWTDGDDQGEPTKQPTDAAPRDDTAPPADGVTTERFIDRENGAVVHSEYATPRSKAWDQRHTVTLRDGRVFVHEQAGPFSRTYLDGELIAVQKWTENGPEPQPVLHLARRPLAPRPAGDPAEILGAIAIYNAIVARWRDWRQGGEIAALSFDPSALQNAKEGGPAPKATALTRKQVEKLCKKFGVVQDYLDSATAAALAQPNPNWTPATFGTDVHWRHARMVNGTTPHGAPRSPSDPENEHFRAERSLVKAMQENPKLTYKQARMEWQSGFAIRGTVRIDVIEDVHGNGKRICVYDIKTGKSYLTLPRMIEIGQSVLLHHPNAAEIIIIESRTRHIPPSPFRQQ